MSNGFSEARGAKHIGLGRTELYLTLWRQRARPRMSGDATDWLDVDTVTSVMLHLGPKKIACCSCVCRTWVIVIASEVRLQTMLKEFLNEFLHSCSLAKFHLRHELGSAETEPGRFTFRDENSRSDTPQNRLTPHISMMYASLPHVNFRYADQNSIPLSALERRWLENEERERRGAAWLAERLPSPPSPPSPPSSLPAPPSPTALPTTPPRIVTPLRITRSK